MFTLLKAIVIVAYIALVIIIIRRVMVSTNE